MSKLLTDVFLVGLILSAPIACLITLICWHIHKREGQRDGLHRNR